MEASDAQKDGIEKYNKLLRKCNVVKATLLNNVDAVANLSAADGCVVLSEHFQVQGFGGSISVSREEAGKSDNKVKLSLDHTCSVKDFLGSIGGERHQSAARLVIKYPNVIVIVVSQDGELSVFASDDDGIIRKYGPVHPYFNPK